MNVSRDDLYTIRWGVQKNRPEVALEVLNKLLGPEATPVVHEGVKKVAVVIGHNPVAQGADSPYLHVSEFDFNTKVAARLKELGSQKYEIEVFSRRALGSYSREIADVYHRVNEFCPAVALELHFNAGGGNYACALAAQGSDASGKFAAIVSSMTAEAIGCKSVGVVRRSAGDRGGASLFAAKSPCVLAEPFFGDSKENCQSVSTDKLAEAYLRSIGEFLG